MKHDPSYVSGTHFAPEIGAYGGWIAHEGSFAARQSDAVTPEGTLLALSGECFPPYADAEGADGRGVSTSSRDAGSLLRLYEARGSAFVAHLNGLFSGLLIDPKRKVALLFNDRYGMERIYVHEKDGTTFFASEAKALLSVLPELRAFDDHGVAQFLKYGCTLDKQTLFRNIELLSGGSLWRFDGGTSCIKDRYFQPKEWESQSPLTEDAFEVEFAETFKRILPRYLSSETTLGVSITGGLDTRMIMACIDESGVKPICYTFAGQTGATLDARLGARVAQVCGLEHRTLRIGADFLAGYGHYVDRTAFVTDGCAGALGAHELYLTGLASRLSPVRLTGNYGSEILRSVSTSKPAHLASSLIVRDFSPLIDAQDATASGVHPVTHAAFREIPWYLFGTLAAGRSQLTFRTPYLDNELVALAFRAPTASRHSPRAALRLINAGNPSLGRIPTDRGLVWRSPDPFGGMRRSFCEATFRLDYLDKAGLPHWLSPFDAVIGSLSNLGLLGLHQYLPYRGWFRRELAGYVRDVLTDAHTQHMPCWNPRFLPSIVSDHVAGRRNYMREIGLILTLEAIDRTLIQGLAHPIGAQSVL